MKIVYLINVDWFFLSHFLHLARRARRLGYEVTVVTNVTDHRDILETEGLKVVDLPVQRGGLSALRLLGAARIVAGEMRTSPGAILHGFGLFGVGVGALAGLFAPGSRRVFSITGRGYLAVAQSLKARLVNTAVRLFCATVADTAQTRWIAENRSDLTDCGLSRALAGKRAIVVGGAGVDLDAYGVADMPERPPLKCGLVARMVWSKGVDVAVEAVTLARQAGLDVELTLAGPRDEGNPRSLSAGTLDKYNTLLGIKWVGRIADIPGFWATQHLAVLPSRGGEGVPRTLIEAVACGRPALTTTVPGCHEFAQATRGWTVPPDNAPALAQQFIEIAKAGDLAMRGMAGRAVVGEKYSEQCLWDNVLGLYRELDGSGATIT